MAATSKEVPGSQNVIGTRYRAFMFDFTLDSSYPSGGYVVKPQLVGVQQLKQIAFVQFMETSVSGYSYFWDATNGAIRVFNSAAFTPAGTVSAPTINTVTDAGTPTKSLGELTGALSTNGAVTGITGVQAPTFTGTAQAAGALAEVATATNLSTVIVRVLFITLP